MPSALTGGGHLTAYKRIGVGKAVEKTPQGAKNTFHHHYIPHQKAGKLLTEGMKDNKGNH